MTSAAKRSSRAKLFVISAPSGCGKTTLTKMLLDGNLGLTRSVSVTTRPPRVGEKDGEDYFFVSRRKFSAMISQKEFLEYEDNFGKWYGTPKQPIAKALREGRPVVLSIDVKGAATVRRIFKKKSVLVFILPPSMKVLEERLVGRGTDDRATIETRLGCARREMAYKKKFDYRIVNDDLSKTYARLQKIVKREMMRKD